MKVFPREPLALARRAREVHERASHAEKFPSGRGRRRGGFLPSVPLISRFKSAKIVGAAGERQGGGRR